MIYLKNSFNYKYNKFIAIANINEYLNIRRQVLHKIILLLLLLCNLLTLIFIEWYCD